MLYFFEVGRIEAEVEAAERELRQTVVQREVDTLDIDAAEVARRLVDELDLTLVRAALEAMNQRAVVELAGGAQVEDLLRADDP
ncbi:MAG: hypothetical protein QM764_17780 [Chitinophagaceae bacterium]